MGLFCLILAGTWCIMSVAPFPDDPWDEHAKPYIQLFEYTFVLPSNSSLAFVAALHTAIVPQHSDFADDKFPVIIDLMTEELQQLPCDVCYKWFVWGTTPIAATVTQWSPAWIIMMPFSLKGLKPSWHCDCRGDPCYPPFLAVDAVDCADHLVVQPNDFGWAFWCVWLSGSVGDGHALPPMTFRYRWLGFLTASFRWEHSGS